MCSTEDDIDQPLAVTPPDLATMDAFLSEDLCEELRDLSVINLIVSMYDSTALSTSF